MFFFSLRSFCYLVGVSFRWPVVRSATPIQRFALWLGSLARFPHSRHGCAFRPCCRRVLRLPRGRALPLRRFCSCFLSAHAPVWVGFSGVGRGRLGAVCSFCCGYRLVPPWLTSLVIPLSASPAPVLCPAPFGGVATISHALQPVRAAPSLLAALPAQTTPPVLVRPPLPFSVRPASLVGSWRSVLPVLCSLWQPPPPPVLFRSPSCLAPPPSPPLPSPRLVSPAPAPALGHLWRWQLVCRFLSLFCRHTRRRQLGAVGGR